MALLTAQAYLIHAAQARGLYVALFEASLAGLPVNIAGEHDVECHYSTRDLTEKLPGRSPSIIANELRWLKNNAWVSEKRGSIRFLGRRIDGTFHLLADVAAQQLTGEERLVSREILGVKLPGAAPTAETTKRGAGRRWSGDPKTKSGGALDLGTRATP